MSTNLEEKEALKTSKKVTPKTFKLTYLEAEKEALAILDELKSKKKIKDFTKQHNIKLSSINHLRTAKHKIEYPNLVLDILRVFYGEVEMEKHITYTHGKKRRPIEDVIGLIPKEKKGKNKN